MKLLKVISVVFFVIALVLGYMLYKNIEGPILERKRVKKEEEKKIAKLKVLREVQKLHLQVRGKYSNNWDSLVAFVQEDTFFTIEKSEEIIPRQYGGDSVIVHIDTIDSIPVKEQLFPSNEYPEFDASKLPYIPGSDKKFKVFADRKEKNNVLVDVFEISDITPISPLSELRAKGDPLRVGSREEVTTSGNWE